MQPRLRPSPLRSRSNLCGVRASRFTGNAHAVTFRILEEYSFSQAAVVRAEATSFEKETVETQSTKLEVLSISDTWVAVNKPAGMLIHRTKLYHSTPGEKYLVDLVSEELERRLGRPTKIYPVQRLDRPTSGVILFAIDSSQNASQLQNVLQSKDCTKEYWTLAFGAEMPEKWINDHPLRDMVGKVRKQRPAYSAFEQLLRLEHANISVVRACIATGRRHQIRRHLSNSRHPIVGDTSHGKGELNRNARDLYGVERCCLHARRVSFTQPGSGDTVTIEAPVPNDLRLVLNRIPDYCAAEHDAVLDLGEVTRKAINV